MDGRERQHRRHLRLTGAAGATAATTPDEFEAKRLLAEAGLQVAPELVVRSSEDAAETAEKIGFPVVMKILSPHILHKNPI
ncbi:acetate--CoA ligase family protein [Chelativorans sp. YIM 93263]|uniref:acetate--CoA ligase family protein n=1 Tax=Chelativorans sp. YIM 93263 TaxID=2906648 RepID=UPI00403E2B7B